MQNMFDSLILYILNRYIKVFLVAPGNQAVGGSNTATLKLKPLAHARLKYTCGHNWIVDCITLCLHV